MRYLERSVGFVDMKYLERSVDMRYMERSVDKRYL